MGNKNFGPAVSGYLIPTGRNWETTVFQAGKPVLDKELNLQQDIDGGQAEADLQREMPSGWISDDFLITSSPTSGFFVFNAASLTLQLVQGLVAHVNGWLLKIQHTNVINTNTMPLTAGPTTGGRTDIVVLEVWRMLLSAAPSVVGKSVLGNIFQYGNVKTDPANDATLNYPDDIRDSSVGSETTKRVQIQYRLRVVSGVDLFTYPYGLDDPTVVANTVPPNATTPDGVATAYPYVNQSANGDPGLWLAGDGNPSNSLGTVDGYMYAIPFTGVFRRNTSAWARTTNQNGGAATPGPSTRPDGYFTDVIESRDLVDLRQGVSPTGWNFEEVLSKNWNYLLDNNINSEWTLNSTFGGGGIAGATLPSADEIGPEPSDGAAPLIGDFDSVRRFISDRAILETVTVAVAAPGGGWTTGSNVTIDPTALTIPPYNPLNWSSYAASTAFFMDIEDAWFIGAASGKKTFDALPYIAGVTNLGAVPVAAMTVTIGNVTGLGLTNETLYVTLVIAYPTGLGLTLTPVNTYGANSFALTGGSMPASAPVSFSAFANQNIDETHREVQLQYTTGTLTITEAANTQITGDATFRLPERAATLVSVSKNGGPSTPATLDSTGRVGTLTSTTTSPGDTLTIQYTALRPLPQDPTAQEQMTIYYDARAPQPSRQELLGSGIQVIPKYVSKQLYVLTTGAGSQDEGYPWPQGYVQTGGIFPSSTGTFNGESDLSARAAIAVTEFNASTGFLQLPIYIPMVANPEQLSFSGVASDIENRSYFNAIPGGTYVPNAFAQDLATAKLHKNILPMLCELAADSPLGHRGQLVLIMLIRYALFDANDSVVFNADETMNTTVASVVRLKGNLLNKRAV